MARDKPKVLVVEDDLANRFLMRDILRSMDLIVLEAENGQAGVKLAKESLPDLILMDIQMPVMDGETALNLLKSDQSTKDIPVIAVTSYAMRGDREKFTGKGFSAYISKPYDIKEIRGLINTWLGAKGSTDH